MKALSILSIACVLGGLALSSTGNASNYPMLLPARITCPHIDQFGLSAQRDLLIPAFKASTIRDLTELKNLVSGKTSKEYNEWSESLWDDRTQEVVFTYFGSDDSGRISFAPDAIVAPFATVRKSIPALHVFELRGDEVITQVSCEAEY